MTVKFTVYSYFSGGHGKDKEWPGWAELQPTQEDKDKADRTDPDILNGIQMESDLNTLSNYTRFAELFKNEVPKNIIECQQRLILGLQLLLSPYQRNLRKGNFPCQACCLPLLQNTKNN